MITRAGAPSRRGFLRTLPADRGGNVSVELAMLAPILLLGFLGVVEYGRAYTE
jgi:Flp pilus assembly protein TadG